MSFGDGAMGAASRALWIFPQLQLAELHPQRIDQQQPPNQRIATTQNQFDSFPSPESLPPGPGRIPRTPPSAHDGTNPGGGGSGYKQR